MKCTQRLYLTANRKRLVPAGHKGASSLYAVPGDEIPESAAKMFGLVDGALKGTKDAGAGKDKEQKGGSDKGNGKPAPSELEKVKGIGASTAKALTAAGVATIADLAAVDPANPPQVEGLPAVFSFGAVVEAAKELVSASGDGA